MHRRVAATILSRLGPCCSAAPPRQLSSFVQPGSRAKNVASPNILLTSFTEPTPSRTHLAAKTRASVGIRSYTSKVVLETDSTDGRPKLLTMTNGEKVKPTFSKKEMDSRISMVRGYMLENDIGGILFTSYHTINYFADFLYCSFGRPYGLVVTQDKVVTISAEVDGAQPWRRSCTGSNVIYTDWHPDNFWLAVKRELADVGGRIGCEFDHIAQANKAKLDLAVAGKEVVDVATPLMLRRCVKSDEEIAVITELARVCDIGGKAAVEAIVEGAPEYDVALSGTEAMVRELGRSFPHAEFRDTWVWLQSGINTDGAHNALTSRKIEKGDIMNLNTFPMVAGYYAALERTLFFDHMTSDRHLEVWEKNCEVHRRGMEIVKPGMRCRDVALELNEIYRECDLLKYRTIGYGHAIGIVCHYYGREAALELRESNETVLQPNMVVSMEPMLVIPEGEPGAGGYRDHNILVVTEDGARNITHYPYGPEHNIIKK